MVNQRFKKIIEFSKDIVTLVDIDGNVSYVNPVITEIMGYSVDEYLDLQPATLTHPDDLENARQLFVSVRSEPGITKTMQIRNRHRAGHYIWLEFHMTNLLDDPDVQAITVFSRNISHVKQTGEALRQSEQRYRAIVEQQIDVICRLSPDLTLTFVNEPYARLFNESPDGMIGRSIFSFVPEEDHHWVRTNFDAISKDNPISISENRITLPDGSQCWYGWTDIAIFDADAHLVEYQGVGRNISERKRLEHAQDEALSSLGASQKFLENTLNAFPAHTVVLDSDGTIITVNAAWKGFAEENDGATDYYLGENYLQICEDATGIDADGALLAVKGIRDVIEARQDEFYLEYSCHSPDKQRWFGMRVTTFPDSPPRRVLVTHINITERILAEDLLRESEKRFRMITENFQDIIVELDMNGIIRYVSPSANRLTGEPERFIGQHLSGILPELHPDDVDIVQMALESIVTMKAPSPFEYRFRVNGGAEYRWFQATHSFLRQDDEIHGFVLVSRDITQRKESELELQSLYRATSSLFHADSIENLAQLIVNAVVEEFDLVDCGLMLVTKKQNQIRRLARTGTYDVKADSLLTLDGTGLIPLAVRREEIIYVPDVSQNEHYIPNETRTQSELVIPLKTSGGVIAALDLQSAERDAFTERDRRIVIQYAERAAAALETMLLYEEINQRVDERTVELQTAKDQVEAILNSSSEGILTVSISHGIQQANSTFNSMFGYHDGTYFGKPIKFFVHDKFHMGLQNAISGALADNSIQRLEVTAQKKDGTSFDIELGFAPMQHPSDDEDYLVCTVRDISEQKKSHKKIAEERNLLRTLIDISPDFIYIKDLEHRFLLSNTTHAHARGYESPDELIGKSDFDFFPDELAEQFKSEEANIFRSGEALINFEQPSKSESGGFEWASSTKVPLRNLDGEIIGLVGFTRDITEKRRQEQQLRYHASIQESVSDAVIVTDTEFNIQSWNQAAETIYGWKAEEVIGQKSVAILQTQFDSDEQRQRTIQDFNANGAWQDDVIQHHKDGHPIHIQASITLFKDANNTPIGVITTNRDITEKKQQEEELRYLAGLLDKVSDAVITTDENRFISSWNRAAENIYGWTASEAIGKHLHEFLQTVSLTYQSAARAKQTILETGQLQSEIIQKHKDGHDIYLIASANLLRDDNDEIIGIITVNHDITEKKQAEIALSQKLNEELAFQQALKSLHEITIDLAEVADLDSFYKQVIKLGLERLDFDRLAMFLYEPETEAAIGTYGTDDTGQLVDEREVRFQPHDDGLMLKALHNKERFAYIDNTTLYTHHQPTGTGWNAVGVIWNGTETLGWLVIDNAVTQKPLTPGTVEILALYSIAVGTLLARKSEQIALAESEKRYRLLADSASDVILHADSRGKYIYASPSVKTQLGYEPDEILGKMYKDFIHPDDMEAIQEVIDTAVVRQQTEFEFSSRGRHKQGHYVWLELAGTIIWTPEGNLQGFITIARDVTDRKEAEIALSQKIREDQAFQKSLRDLHDITIELAQIADLDNFYKRVVELGLQRLGFDRMGLALQDRDTGEALTTYGTDIKGNVVNEQGIRYMPDDIATQLLAPDNNDRFILRENILMRTANRPEGIMGWNAVSVIWNGTESLGWISVDNAIHGADAPPQMLEILALYSMAVGTLLVRKREQIALAESEARYRLLADHSSDMIMRSNSDGQYTYISPASLTVMGYEADDVSGKTLQDFVHPDDNETIQKQMEQIIANRLSIVDITTRIRHKRGYYIWLEIAGRVIWSDDDLFNGYVASARDITSRIEAEQALIESSLEIEDLYNNAPCGYHSVNDEGIIIAMNDTGLKWMGYDRDEIVNKMGYRELMTPASQETFQSNFPVFLETGRVSNLEFDLIRKDGSTFTVSLNATAVYDENGQILRSRSTMFDVSERKEAVAKLRESEQRFRNLVEVAPVGIIISNAQGVITLVNEQAQLMFAYDRDDLEGQKIEVLIDDSLHEKHAAYRSTYVENPVLREMGSGLDLYARRSDGAKFPVEIQLSYIETGDGIQVMSFIEDVTARKEAESNLRTSEEKYRNLVETMGGGLIMSDKDAVITYVNDRFCEMLGYSHDELIGGSYADFVPQHELEKISHHLDIRRQGKNSFYEVLVPRKDNTPIHLLVSGSPLIDKNGVFSGSNSVFMDITRQKEAENALRQSLAREKELNELKSRFVSMASHEFRTPLATILATTETIAAYRHKLSDEKIESRLKRIKEQIAHLTSIMDDVLLLAKMQQQRVSYNPTGIDLDSLCRSVLDEFENRPDINHEIDYKYDANIGIVNLDKKLMRQIINNLVSNAIKYSPRDQTVQVHLTKEANTIILMVQDKGIGIPEDDLKHLFEPFHRATNVGTVSGTGLGLVITREAIELHSGTIHVDSSVKVGTTITVKLPIQVT